MNELELTARHEAGHIVAAKCLGATIVDAGLSMDRASRTAGFVTWSWGDKPIPDQYQIKVYLAGPAISILDGDPNALTCSKNDIDAVVRILSRYGDDREKALNLLTEMVEIIEKAADFLNQVDIEAAQLITSHQQSHDLQQGWRKLVMQDGLAPSKTSREHSPHME